MSERYENDSTQKKGGKALRIILAIILILVFIYAAGVVAFSFITMPRTVVNERNADFRTATALGDILEGRTDKMFVVELNDGSTWDIPLYQIDGKMKKTEAAKAVILSQDNLIWPYTIIKGQKIAITPEFTCSEDKVRENISVLYSNLPKKKSEDAYLDVDSTGTVIIRKEKIGTEMEENELVKRICDALQKGQLNLSADEVPYTLPEIMSDNGKLQVDCSLYNELLNREITVDLNGAKEKIRSGDFIDTEVLFASGETVVLEDKIEDHVKTLAVAYSSFGPQTEVTVVPDDELTDEGSEEKPVETTYTSAMDIEATKAAIEQAIYDSSITEINAVWETDITA